jgi:hypothetical protein
LGNLFFDISSADILARPFKGSLNKNVSHSFLIVVNPVHRQVVIRIFNVLYSNFSFFPTDSHVSEGLDDVFDLHGSPSESMFRSVGFESFDDFGIL